MGKICSKLANGLNFYDLKKTLTPGVVLTLTWGYIHYITIIVKEVYWNISQVSGERLQDHWSSGSLKMPLNSSCAFIENDENVPQSCLKVISKNSFAYIVCVFWKVRTVSVEIDRIDLGRTLFTSFGSNVWRN